MTRTAVIACVLAGVAGAAQASTVEFRLVERRGQSVWTGGAGGVTNDNILNFAVQARVVGGAAGEAMGNFGFDILTNEASGNGTLAKARISVAGTGAYDTSLAQYANFATVNVGGLSAIYAYLAGINGQFNGLINTSGGSFTATPGLNSIGLITGSPTGGSLLLLTDLDGDGNPDTYTGGATAPLDPAVAATYLGSDGGFVDVYHFNYAISSNASRTAVFTIAGAQAQTFSFLALANGVWGPGAPLNAVTSASGAQIVITPAPASVALLGLGGLLAARRRRA